MKWTPSLKWYLVLAFLFAVAASVNFNKPFGFFRESNPALVAINATYWTQHPEIKNRHVPVSSYGFRQDQPPATQLDHTITTFGYAWFAAPYYFLRLFHLAPGPVSLRIFSACWLLLTLLVVYKLALELAAVLPLKKAVVFICLALYAFSPVVSWYQVNGYVHETAVLPFYYAAWLFFLRFLRMKKPAALWITGLLLFIGLQFDWLPFFQGALMSAYLLFNRKLRLHPAFFLLPALAVTAGLAYIVFTYTSWATWDGWFGFMKWKFMSRTLGQEAHSFLSFWPTRLNILLFYGIGFGVILICLVPAIYRNRFPPLIWLMIATALTHHLVFWGFSSEHDYATLKMAFPIAFLSATWLAGLPRKKAMALLAGIIAACLLQYFFLDNYPYRKGIYTREDFFEKTGALVRGQPTSTLVLVNTGNSYYPQLEFYAGRRYGMAENMEEARHIWLRSGIGRAVFIDADGSLTEMMR